MQGKINLFQENFSETEKVLYESGTLCVATFQYRTGIEGVRLQNSKGFVTLLPFMGQMIWKAEFLGHNLVMKSIYDMPEPCREVFGESYGCFLMHCGLTAMGNPTSLDSHLPHGELPIAKYQEAYILIGEDGRGKYVAMGGIYHHKRAFEMNYEFIPECRLYENASTVELTVTINNKKDLPLEYFYLCHINYRPEDGSRLLYTARHKNITAHREVLENYPQDLAEKTNAYLDALEKDISIMDTIDKASQSYAPEIVFTCRYDADENGLAYTLQKLPDGYSHYVCHRPEELPFGIRWIARTGDEDAMGMVLPATAEHKGYSYCKSKGYERYLKSGESVTYHITAGILSPEDSRKIEEKITDKGEAEHDS